MTIYKSTVTGTFTAGDIWNTDFHMSSVNNLATVHAAATTFINNLCTGTMNAMWPTDVSVTGITTNQLDPVTGKQVAQTSSGLAQTGTGAGGKPSPRDCVLLSLRTNLPQKSGRGRMYLPSVDASHYTATGRLVQADMTTIANAVGPLLTTLAATAPVVIFHRKILGFDVVVQVKVPDLAATQRRRTNKDPIVYASHAV
jgi:hypothetical protein